MADDADITQERQERELDLFLRERRAPLIQATGVCLNCNTPLKGERRWCDADCRDDWERQQKRKVERSA